MKHIAPIRKNYHPRHKGGSMITLMATIIILSSSTARAEDKTSNKTTLDVKVRVQVYPLEVFTDKDCSGNNPKEECTFMPIKEKTNEESRAEQTAIITAWRSIDKRQGP